MTKQRILITGKIHQDTVEKFKGNPNYDVHYHPDAPTESLLDLIPGTHALITRSETCIDSKLLNRADSLKVIGRAAVGVANIDIDLASKKGILVFNTPKINTNSAAELTWTILLSMVRKSYQAQKAIKEGGWDRHKFYGHELRDKTIGIVGLGNVGHRIAKFAHGFDMNVLGYDPYIHPKLFHQYKVTPHQSLLEMAQQVDILTIHVPLTQSTKEMIDLRILSSIKTGGFLINTSRGGIVKEEDLLLTLDNNQLKGVAIDTWVDEPKIHKKLRDHPKVVGTPHIGASTFEAQKKIGESIYQQINKALSGKIVDSPINLPINETTSLNKDNSYTLLSEKMGSFISQYLPKNLRTITLSLPYETNACDSELLFLGFMKGFVAHISDEYISYVNAKSIFEKLGISTEVDKNPNFSPTEASIEYKITDNYGKESFIRGIVYGKNKIKLTMLDQFSFEIEPSGKIIIIKNIDEPRVVGNIGLTLACHGINIDSFTLSRIDLGENALALIKVDSKPDHNTLEDLRKFNSIKNVSYIHL